PDDWESKRLAAALREHLARSPLWKQWDDWVRLREVALADLLGRLDLASAAASRSDATKPATDLQVLLQRHTEALLWPGSGLDMRAADIPVQSEEKVIFGAFSWPFELPVDAPTDQRIAHELTRATGLMESAKRWPEVIEGRALVNSIGRLRVELATGLEDVVLRRVLPGTCALCSQTGQKRHRR